MTLKTFIKLANVDPLTFYRFTRRDGSFYVISSRMLYIRLSRGSVFPKYLRGTTYIIVSIQYYISYKYPFL